MVDMRRQLIFLALDAFSDNPKLPLFTLIVDVMNQTILQIY